jgi:hypothetical protein
VPLGLLLAGQDAAEELGGGGQGAGAVAGDPVAIGDAVAALRRYSLAAALGDGLVQVHRLVQAVTRAQLTDGEASESLAATSGLTARQILFTGLAGNLDLKEGNPAMAPVNGWLAWQTRETVRHDHCQASEQAHDPARGTAMTLPVSTSCGTLACR